MPANTGEAGAIQRAGFFAGTPAPTVTEPGIKPLSLAAGPSLLST